MTMRLFLTLAAMIVITAGTARAQLISEFQPNPNGPDPAMQQIEIWGTPNAALPADLAFLIVDANGGSVGEIENLVALGGNFDANGLFTTTTNDLESPSFIAILASGFSGAVGDDLDTDDDGTFDVTPWLSLTDSISILDNPSDTNYADTLGGETLVPPDSIGATAFDDEPILAFRDSLTGDWIASYEIDGSAPEEFVFFNADGQIVDNDFGGLNPLVGSFGAINPTAVPEPSSLAVVSILLGGMITRRRRC